MSYGRRSIIQFGPDDYGVYLSMTRGPLGTPLQVRGSWDLVTNLDIEVRFSGIVIKAYNRATGGYEFLPPEKRGLGYNPEQNYPKIIDGKDLVLR